MKTISVLAVLLAATVATAGTEPVSVVEPITVTARGRAATLTETPGGVGVVTEEEIAVSPKNSIAEALARIPGVSVSGDSPWGRDVSIRGLTGPAIVVLLDGKRINTATDINARLGFINPLDIERVEVLKGPVSSLYGTGSTGGVVNIITRKGSFSPEGRVGGRQSHSVSSNPFGYDGSGNLHYDGEQVWLFASGAARNHGTTHGGGNERIDNSGYADAQGRLAAGFLISEGITLQLQALHAEVDEAGLPGGPATLPRTARVSYPRVSHTFLGADLVWKPAGGALREVASSLYYNRNERRVRVNRLPNPAVARIMPSADHGTLGGTVRGTMVLGRHTLVSGVDAWGWNMDSWRLRQMASGTVVQDTPVPRARQISVGIYAEDDWKLGEYLTLNLGVRGDRVATSNGAGNGFAASTAEDFGWNIHAGVTWKTAPAWTQSLIVASSYRAADILERFKLIDLGGGVQLRGNPGLDPEKSLYGEYGVHYRTGSLRGDLRLFVNQVYDLITEERVSANQLRMANVGRALIYGAELEGRWALSDSWSLFSAVTGMVGVNAADNEPLRSIAPLSGNGGVDYDDGRFRAGLGMRWAAAQHETPGDVASCSGYVTFNALAGYRFQAGPLRHDISLVLDNLFDVRYRSHLSNSRGIELLEPGFSAMLTYGVSL